MTNPYIKDTVTNKFLQYGQSAGNPIEWVDASAQAYEFTDDQAQSDQLDSLNEESSNRYVASGPGGSTNPPPKGLPL